MKNLQAASSIVQSATASDPYNSPSTSIVTTLPSTATANNILVTAIALDKNSGAITVPSGFTLIHDYTSSSVSGAMAYKVAAGGEQAITWSYTNTEEASAWVAEISGLETSGVLDVSVENDSGTSAVASLSTGTTSATTQANEFAIAMVATDSGNKTGSGRAWTNGFTEIEHVTTTSGSPSLDVATKTLTSTGTQETTFSVGGSGDQMYAMLATFKEASPGSGFLTSTDVEPASLVINQSGDVDVSFTTENTIPTDGKIKITFPTDLGSGFTFDSGGTTDVSSVSGIDGTLTVSHASNVITLTRSGGTVSAAGAKSFTLSNIQNPSATGSTGVYEIETTDASDSTIDIDSSVSADTITASMTSPSISLDESLVSAVATHTITFTTTTLLPSDGKIVLTYPNNLGSFTFDSGASTTAQNITGIDGTLSFSESSGVVTLTRSGGSDFSPGTISFELTNIANPSTAGVTNDFAFKTTNSSDVTIDENTSVSGVTILPGLQGTGTTIGLVSDGDDNSGTNASAAMTEDLDHLITQLPSGWGLDTLTWQGDIAYSGNDVPAAITAWENSLAAAAPIFFTPGNHDVETTADIDYLEAYFASYPDYNLQGATEISYASGTNYSYEIGDVHVAVVNQYVDDATMSNRSLSNGSGGGYIEDSVFEWLKNDLRSSTKTHMIVTGHEPAYPKNRHVGDSLDATPANRDKFVNLLASYGVAAHAVGHTHFAELYEMIYDENTSSDSTLLGGIWEIDTGAFGTKAGSEDPAIGYFHANSSDWGDYELRLVEGSGSPDWATPTVRTATHADLSRQILVNTWTGAGTGSTDLGLFDMQYFVDYSSVVESNPDWSSNNSGRWWEPAFDADAAGWTDGELAVGYDDNSAAWGWLNTEIDPDPTSSGGNQVHSIFGRVTFQAENPASYGNLDLEVDWDDSVIFWLNGVPVQSITTSITTPSTGSGSEYFDQYSTDTTHGDNDGKELAAPVFTTFDIKAHLGDLVDGTNVLTYMTTNNGTSEANALASSDLAVGVRLSMYGERTSNVTQQHYGWRNDDGTESTATFVTTEDTPVTGVDVNTEMRLRTLVSNEGALSDISDGMVLQWANSTVGAWSNVESVVTCGNDPVCLTDSVNLTDGASTTNIVPGLSDEAATFIPGFAMDTNTVSPAIQLGSDEFTEMEHALIVTTNANPGTTYYLRLVQATGGDLGTYNVYPSFTTSIPAGTDITATFQEGVNGYTGTIDTVIKADLTTTNSGNDTTLEVDSTPDWGGLIEWDISSIDPSAVVSAASITFEVVNESVDEYFMYQTFRDWTELGATWTTADGSTSWGSAGANDTTTDRSATPVGSVNLGGGNTGTHVISLNATGVQMVQDWIDGTDPNHGITIQNYAGSGNGVDLVSSEGGNVSQRPLLSVTYSLPGDLPPTVASVTSSVADGTYSNGDTIDLIVTFSENVTSTGDVTVTLDTGDTCTFTITNQTTGSCDYIVSSADNSPDLSVVSVTGIIEDGEGNTLVNTNPIQNLNDTKDIVIENTIDLVAPYVIDASSSVIFGNTYSGGETIDLTVTFSENVTSTGDITVTLGTGDTCTFTLTDESIGTCSYTVVAGDTSYELAISSVAGLVLDQAGNGLTFQTQYVTIQ